MIFKPLTKEEEKEYRSFVDEDIEIQNFLKKVSIYHPVIRDEIILRLKNSLEGI
jgi:hypothetical protein